MSIETDIRLQKRESLIERGINPYPYIYEVNIKIKELKENFSEYENKEFSFAGRLMSIRKHGKATFANIADQSGNIQLYFKSDDLGKDNYKLLKKIDIGDFLGVKGLLMKTMKGEITIKITSWELLSKALNSLPEKFHGLKDSETRFRQRYLDFISNPESREIIITRSKIIKTIRKLLDSKDFLEVETPILQPVYGGAFAEPFITHYNSLDSDFYLRVSNELYLKRLLIGGFERIYEFAKDFRNEGIDRDHNPEFTQIEVYWAFVDYYKIMELVEEIFLKISENVFGKCVFNINNTEIDFSKPWKRVDFYKSLSEKIGEDIKGYDEEKLFKLCEKFNIEAEKSLSKGKYLDLLFSDLVQVELIEPSFVLDHPIEISPLAKKHREKEGMVERFEPIINGMELGNSFSELNDPVEQRKRLEFQSKLREKGEKEFEPIDEDFLQAMSYGMPPAGGLGLGIDRIVMLFTNSENIKEVLTFPQLKPKTNKE